MATTAWPSPTGGVLIVLMVAAILAIQWLVGVRVMATRTAESAS